MKSFPFESQITGYTPEGYPILDRAIDSTILSKLDKLFFNNGVFANPSTNFQVVQASGMTVDVYAGACIIEGARGYEDTTRNLSVEASNTVYDRIDTVVLRLNHNVEVRSIDLYVKKGTASTTPTAPALTRDSSIYELGIANLFIAKNTTTITQARITDTRLDTSRCGIATPFENVDTDGIFNQYQDALDQYLELVRNSLDDTQAGYLQGLINDLETALGNRINALETLKGNTTKIVSGSFTKQVTAGSKRILVFTNAEIEALTGISGATNLNTMVVMSNGNSGVLDVGISASYGTQGWSACLDSASTLTTPFRINYTIIRF